MAIFSYKAKNSKGEIVEGSFHMGSLSEAAAHLEKRGYTILEVKEESGNMPADFLNIDFSQETVLSVQEKKDFFNSFYSLYKSGHSVLEIFDLIYASTKCTRIKTHCAKILHGIKQGHSLKESMKCCTNALGKAYTMLIVAGEESGKLEDILSEIVKNVMMQEKIKNDVISKATYPAAMFLFAIFVALLFKTFIIEVFNSSIAGVKVCITTLAIKALIQISLVFGVITIAIYLLYKNKSLLAKLASKLIALKDCYVESVRRLSVIADLIYTDYNIHCMKEMTVLSESMNAMYFNEFKIFKFQNLIRATI